MLHFRIRFKHDIKVFLVEYDSNWSVIADKTAHLFEIPASHVVLMHKDRDGTTIQLSNQEELRAYLLGPKSARAVAGLPLDFALLDTFGDKDTQNWKYSIISHIGASEVDEAEYEKPESVNDLLHSGQNGKFTDEDYTFVQPPALDASDMVNIVVPGEGLYAVPRRAGVGSTPNIELLDLKHQDDDGTWDDIPPPSESEGGRMSVSVDYPNIYLDEPPKPQSVASSGGPPRIPSRDKGKGRARPASSLDAVPMRLRQDSIELVSDRSVRNSDPPRKPSIYTGDGNHPMSPIPLISNIVKKMSLENAKARTIGDMSPTTPTMQDKGYETLVNQLVSLVDVVSNLLEDDGVKHQIRGVWDGFSTKSLKQHLSPTTPGGGFAESMHSMAGKPKEIALAEGLVNVMKRVATIVDEDEVSDVEEQDGDVIWTYPGRASRVHTDIRLPQVDPETKPATPTVATPRATKTSPPPSVLVKSSKQRLEEAKANYKAEKAKYRAEREHKRREKLAAKGLMVPEPNDPKESDEDPVEVTPAPPGRRTSLMSAGEAQPRARSRIEPSEKAPRAGSSVKPSAGSTYSPVLLPARLSHNVAAPPIKMPTAPFVKEEVPTDVDEAGADAGSEGPGTPKPPPRPARTSTQFDFDAFMEANAWAPKASPGWLHEQSPTHGHLPTSATQGHFPTSARPSIAMQGTQAPRSSMNPPPVHMYMQTGALMDSPRVFETASNLDNENSSIPPTPPPRPRVFSPTHSATPPPSHAQPGMETMMADAFRVNPAPRMSLKRNRWGDGLGGRRMDVGSVGPIREDSMTAVDALAHPPPVYSTDGEGGDDVLESGGPPRPAKGMLPLNEEFKRRCLTILHEYNATRERYPTLDYLIGQGIQAVNTNRQMVRLAAESNPQARETFLSEEVPNVVNRVLATIQRGSTPNYV